MRKSQEDAIRAHFALPTDIARLARAASTDLYHGPGAVEDEDYPGFVAACKRLDNELPISDVWVDSDGSTVSEIEPEWTVECPACEGADDECTECEGVGEIPGECPEDWTFVDASVSRRLILGPLMEYL
jgi:hypothetical protein